MNLCLLLANIRPEKPTYELGHFVASRDTLKAAYVSQQSLSQMAIIFIFDTSDSVIHSGVYGEPFMLKWLNQVS